MRFLISVVFVAAGTAAGCHGFFLEKEAKAYLESHPLEKASLFQLVGVQERFPYSPTSVAAREELLRRHKPDDPTGGEPPLLEYLAARVGNGFRPELPYVDPYALGAVALAGLVLAGIFPGTRFRGTVWTLFLLGGGALVPSYLTQAHQASLVETAQFSAPVLAHFPWVSAGLLVLAGLFLGAHRSGRRDG